MLSILVRPLLFLAAVLAQGNGVCGLGFSACITEIDNTITAKFITTIKIHTANTNTPLSKQNAPIIHIAFTRKRIKKVLYPINRPFGLQNIKSSPSSFFDVVLNIFCSINTKQRPDSYVQIINNGEQLCEEERAGHAYDRNGANVGDIRPAVLVYAGEQFLPGVRAGVDLALAAVRGSLRVELLLLQADHQVLGIATALRSRGVLLRRPRAQLHRATPRPLHAQRLAPLLGSRGLRGLEGGALAVGLHHAQIRRAGGGDRGGHEAAGEEGEAKSEVPAALSADPAVSPLQQELILILMQVDIPIIVTRKGRPGDPTFKNASPHLLEQLKDARSPSLPKPRNTNLEPRHQTLDPSGTVTASRTRRISSSAAAKRFPKDFFKDENCLHPIKSIRPKHKQCEPIEPCFLDTFSHKNFLVCQDGEKNESDTPKFKQKSEKTEHSKNDRLRNKVQQLIQETSVSKYHTASDHESKHPLLQIFEPQRQDPPLQQQPQPFGALPFISNFNVTLGQKVALSYLMKAQKSKRKKAEEKENNEELCPDSARRDSNMKAEGFRIRKKILS